MPEPINSTPPTLPTPAQPDQQQPQAAGEPSWHDLFKAVDDHYNDNPPSQQQAPTIAEAAAPRQRPDRKRATDEAEKEAGAEKPLGVTNYAMDAVEGIGAGAEGFVRSIGKLGNDIVESLGGHLVDDPHTWDNHYFKTKTWLGGLTSGITQFAIGFLPGLGIAGWAGKAAGLTGAALKLGTSLGAGALADFAGFRDDQERLSNIIQGTPLANPVNAFLSSDKDDNFLLGRVKNAVEGLGLGAVGELFTHSLRGFKGRMLAVAANDPQAYKQATEDAAKAISPLAKQLQGQDADLIAHPELAGGKQQPRTIRDVVSGVDRKPWEGAPKEMADTVAQFVRKGMPEDVAISEAVKTHLNMERIESPADLKRFGTYANAAADEWVQANNPEQNLKFVQTQAQEMADIMGKDPKLMWNSVAVDAENVTDMAKRLVAYRMNREGQAAAIQQMATQIMSSGLDDAGQLKALAGAVKEHLSLHNGIQYIQKEMARGPSYGRITASPNEFNLNYLAKQVDGVLRGDAGSKAKAEFVRSLVAAEDDPKGMFNVLKGVGNFFSTGLAVHNEYWKNALLSGLHTQAVKLMSDITNTLVFPAERMLGGMFQGDFGQVTAGAKMYMHLAHSALDVLNLNNIAQKVTAKVGSTLGTAGKSLLTEGGNLLEEHEPMHAISADSLGINNQWAGQAVNYLGQLVRLPSRLLSTTDTLMQTLNYRAYLRQEGFDQALQKGIKDPEEFANFVANHIISGYGEKGEALNEMALKYAKSSSFQDDLIKGTLGHTAQQAVNNHPGLQLIMPFVKTPTNIFRRFVQMTPGINFLQNQYAQMWNSVDPAIRAQARGRMALGGSVWMSAIAAAQTGRLTGGGPSNANEKNALLESGWRPYSIVLTGDDGKKTYIDYRRFEPFAYMLGLSADFAEAAGRMDEADHTSMSQAMTFALAHNLSSKTYFNGIAELCNVLSQPDKQVQRWLNIRAGAYVPSLIARANDDDYMREATTMMDAIKRRIPGMSDSLPPVRNLFGEPVNPLSGWLPFGMGGGAAGRVLSPAAMSQSVDDNVKQELARLQYGFTKAPKTYQGFNLEQFERGNSNAYDRFQELHGQVQIGGQTMQQALQRLMDGDRYKSMPQPEGHQDTTNPRIQAVTKILADYREKAMQQTLKEYPEIGRAVQLYRQQGRGPASPSPVMQALGQQ